MSGPTQFTSGKIQVYFEGLILVDSIIDLTNSEGLAKFKSMEKIQQIEI